MYTRIERDEVCAIVGAALNIAHARNITKRATLANNDESGVTRCPRKCAKRAATMRFKQATPEVLLLLSIESSSVNELSISI